MMPRWVAMWAIAFALYGACKWPVHVHAAAVIDGFGRCAEAC